jgi:hypothetical protein
MPRCGAAFVENNVPLGQGGTSGGFLGMGQPTYPGAPRPLSFRADVAVIRRPRTRHTNHPCRGRRPGIPSSTEEGSSFSRERLARSGTGREEFEGQPNFSVDVCAFTQWISCLALRLNFFHPFPSSSGGKSSG